MTQTDKNIPKPAAKPLARPMEGAIGEQGLNVFFMWHWQEGYIGSVSTGLSLSSKCPLVLTSGESLFYDVTIAHFFWIVQTEGGHVPRHTFGDNGEVTQTVQKRYRSVQCSKSLDCVRTTQGCLTGKDLTNKKRKPFITSLKSRLRGDLT